MQTQQINSRNISYKCLIEWSDDIFISKRSKVTSTVTSLCSAKKHNSNARIQKQNRVIVTTFSLTFRDFLAEANNREAVVSSLNLFNIILISSPLKVIYSSPSKFCTGLTDDVQPVFVWHDCHWRRRCSNCMNSTTERAHGAKSKQMLTHFTSSKTWHPINPFLSTEE